MMRYWWLVAPLVGAFVLASCGGLQTEVVEQGDVAVALAPNRVVDATDENFAAMATPGYWVDYGASAYGETWVCWPIATEPSASDFRLVYTPPGYTWRLGVVTKGSTHHIFENPFPVQGDVFETGGFDQVIACKVFDGAEKGALLVRKKDAGTTYLAGAVFTVEPGGYVMTEIEPGIHCLAGLAIQEYTVTETTPPPGYEGDPTPRTLTPVAGTDCASNRPTDWVVFVNTPVPGTVKVYKVDGAGAPLAGATFRLTGPADYDESCTTALPDAACVFGGLAFGSYTLDEEGLPDGYTLGDVTLAGVGAVSLPNVFEVGLGSEPGEGKTFTFTVENLPEEEEDLDVTKTVVTSFKRTHDWSIAKSVDPGSFYLTFDGAGDGTATWTIDVTYEGYQDSDFNVSGEITIENVGGLDAVITSVADVLAEAPIDVDCGVTFPYTLPVGETLTCTYDEDGYVEGDNEVTVTTERDTYGYSKAIAWGAPAPELHKTVTVVDESDLLGTQTLGTLTAPNGDRFTYTEDFAWADYGHDECGAYTYRNTAKVKGDGGVVLDFDTAELDVEIPCLEFAGETAWAANGDDPLELPYNPDHGGNWATYVVYSGAEKTTTLFAGQHMDAGRVTFSAPADGMITVTVAMDAAWAFEDVFENLKVQDYASAPSGNPSPGLFDHKLDCDVAESSCSIVVPENGYYGVHVNVGRWVPVVDGD